jgi:hypothetical protein
VFWVISVYFNIRDTLPKYCTFLLEHSVYLHSYIQYVLLRRTAAGKTAILLRAAINYCKFNDFFLGLQGFLVPLKREQQATKILNYGIFILTKRNFSHIMSITGNRVGEQLPFLCANAWTLFSQVIRGLEHSRREFETRYLKKYKVWFAVTAENTYCCKKANSTAVLASFIVSKITGKKQNRLQTGRKWFIVLWK